jgi:hypothetical protein
MKTTFFAAVLGLGVLVSGAAFATDAAAPAPTPSPTSSSMMKSDGGAMMKNDKADKVARSQECSKEADAKGLHGKERKHFREKCKDGKM